jgi:hypothetical protein
MNQKMTKINNGKSRMSKPENYVNKRAGSVSKRRALTNSTFSARLMLVLAAIMIVASCASAPRPMRAQSTGKTIRTATPPPDDTGPIIQTAIAGDPGVTDIEIYQGTGEFINKDAARAIP